MRFIKSRFFVFLSTFLLGIAFYWIVIFGLAVLDTKKVINKWNLDPEVREKILDIQCNDDDEYCRGEKCSS